MSTSVEQIKERLAIDEVVGSYMKLEKAGKNLRGKCPFHNEKTPSFYVTPERGSYYCFGCGAKGDIFTFVEQFEGLDFVGALKVLAERAGVEIVYDRDGKGGAGATARAEQKSEKERLYLLMEEATKFFESALGVGGSGDASLPKNPIIEGNTVYSMAAREAREYVAKRGITDETAKQFRIGFAPNEWRLLYTHLKETLRSHNFSDTDIEKAGLAKRPEAADAGAAGGAISAMPKNMYDRFRGRIMFPIMDSSGRVIAFSGRILHDDEKSAKYLNSPDTPLYTKSTVLYGIDKAKQDIRTKNYTIMVEGQMDLVLSHQAGIKNTVAVSGTALSDRVTVGVGETTRDSVVNNLGIVRRLSPNVILAFDSDGAGRKAAMRSATIALSLGMDVKIAAMPEGKDPADMVLNDPESWKNVLRAAKPIVEFQLDGIMAEVVAKKLDSRKIPPLIRERVLPFILSVGGAMERAHGIKLIHERTGLSEESIRADIKVLEKQTAQRAATTSSTDTARQIPAQGGIVSDAIQVTRLDKITRQLFGLLAYLTRENLFDTARIHATVKQIAGEERYNNLILEIEPSKDELILEAEIFFGANKDKDSIANLEKHIDELLANFEEDIVKQDLSSAMAELSRLERKKGDTSIEESMTALMQKCQSLAVRLSEIAKKRAK